MAYNTDRNAGMTGQNSAFDGGLTSQPLLNPDAGRYSGSGRGFGGSQGVTGGEPFTPRKRRTLCGVICGVVFPLAMVLITICFIVAIVRDNYQGFKSNVDNTGNGVPSADGSTNVATKAKSKASTKGSAVGKTGKGKARSGDLAGKPETVNRFAVFYYNSLMSESVVIFKPRDSIILPRVSEKLPIIIHRAFAKMKLYIDDIVLESDEIKLIEETPNPAAAPGAESKIVFKLKDFFTMPLSYLYRKKQAIAYDFLMSTCEPVQATVIKDAKDKVVPTTPVSKAGVVPGAGSNLDNVAESVELVLLASYEYKYKNENGKGYKLGYYNGMSTFRYHCYSVVDKSDDSDDDDDDNDNDGDSSDKKKKEDMLPVSKEAVKH